MRNKVISIGDFIEIDEMPDDKLKPVRIGHLVDDIRVDGVHDQYYNYLVYEFERDGNQISARAYIDDIEEVAITELKPDPELLEDVIAYLKRRFCTIKRLRENGYQTIWRASKDDKD